jgi:hypothetical protein
MTFFDCHAVPASLLLGHNEPPKSREFVEAIGKLQAFSLVSKTSVGDNFEVHRLAHVVTHKWLIIQNMLEYGALEAKRLCLQVLEHSETTGRRNYAQRKECPDTLTSMATANFPHRICL